MQPLHDLELRLIRMFAGKLRHVLGGDDEGRTGTEP